MRPTDIASDPTRIEPEMFRGPRRLSPFSRVLRRLPPSVSKHVLAGLAVGDGFVRSRRIRQALAFAADLGVDGAARWRLALAVLANHGLFVAEEMALGVESLDEMCRDVALEGAEHLAGQRGGAILLGFHLGPPRVALALRACGHAVRFTGRLETASGDGRWSDVLEAEEGVRLPSGTPRGRAEGLYRILNLLRTGAVVYLAADGPFGREAFHLDVPGGRLIIRPGWLTLRRSARVPTLPVLSHRDGQRRVIVIHPPLPDVDPDLTVDVARCKAILQPIVEEYVRSFPSQCRYLAMAPWNQPSP